MSRVSIIVPTYNRPQTLVYALESIAAQQHPDVEAVVVTDGGCDVGDVVGKFAGRLEIRYLPQTVNRGQGTVLNIGLAAATGKYVGVLNDDDTLNPEHAAVLVGAMEKSGAKVAYAEVRMVRIRWEDGKPVREAAWNFAGGPFDRGRLLISNYLPMMSVMFERACLDVTGGFDESLKHFEDWDLWIRLAMKFNFEYVPKKTSEYRTYAKGAVENKSFADSLLGIILPREYIYEKYRRVFEVNPALVRARTAYWQKLLSERRKDFAPAEGLEKKEEFDALSRLCAHAQVWDEALKIAGRWAEKIPSVESFSTLAQILHECGRTQEAVEWMKKVRDLAGGRA